MSAFTNLLGDIAQYAGRGIEQGIQEQVGTESAIRRQTRLFHAGKPLREAARAEEWEAGAPKRRMYGQMLGPILGAEGFVTPPTAERAETEPGGLLTDLDPDLAKTMMSYLEVKRKGEAASQQADFMNWYRGEQLRLAQERVDLTREREPAPSMERDIAARWQRLLEQGKVKPEGEFDWKQGERAKAAGAKVKAKLDVEAETPPIPSPAERAALAGAETSLRLLDTLEQQLGAGEFVGPYRGRLGALTQYVPGLMGREEAEFRANLSTLRNQVIKQITGAALSEPEARRIMQQLPSEELPLEVNKARLKMTRQNTEYLDRITREQLSRPRGSVGRIGGTKPAPKRYASPDAVGAAVRAGKITPEQAKAILQTDFGFE